MLDKAWNWRASIINVNSCDARAGDAAPMTFVATAAASAAAVLELPSGWGGEGDVNFLNYILFQHAKNNFG